MISIKKTSDEIYLLIFNRTVFYDSSIYYEIKKINIIEEKVSIELSLGTPINKIDLLIKTFQELNYEKSNLYKVSIDIGVYSPSKIPFKVLEDVNEKNYPISNFSSYFKIIFLGGDWIIKGTSSPELLENAKL
jgi:hypothetical protein